jgi:phosphomannomutase
MHGAGINVLSELLKPIKIDMEAINDTPDPLFSGFRPEPILNNLQDLVEVVREKKAVLALAIDGDADRFGVLDQDGLFVEVHDLMALHTLHLIKTRNWKGDIVRTTSMSDIVDKVAQEYNHQIIEVPVGFKNVTEMMLQRDVLIGGEESGGFGYRNHIPERDGILSCMLTLEMLGKLQVKISDLVQDLRERYGPLAYGRIDKPADHRILQHNLIRLKKQPPLKIAGFKVEHVDTKDGIKFYLNSDSWMLIRISQTEPLTRIYVVGSSREAVNELLQAGLSLMTHSQYKKSSLGNDR